MDADFWHDRWENEQLGFHEGRPNFLLVAHFDALELPDGARVFLPFCGKTRDIAWLLDRRCRVAAAELSERAIQQLFDELALTPDVSDRGRLRHYRSEGIDIFVGDFFDLDSPTLGRVDAIYDRAALVALPVDMRRRYARHLIDVTNSAPQLLITFDYDQTTMNGPPFSVPGDEIDEHYAGTYDILCLERRKVPGQLKGAVPADECAWHLRPD